ncbi:hypothetical protein IWX90DRAFT_76846 [Phyllosticta citrichinensis]|uniref:Uncharacterized protein n=1 Tax=Phyllosticta citrichinensis TaxID=1130410 RepID=A0ABR1XGK1_9PEZI
MERTSRRRDHPHEFRVFDEWERHEDEDAEGYTRIFRRWERSLPRLLDQAKEEQHFRKSGLTCSFLVRAMQTLKNIEVVTHVAEEIAAQDWELKKLWFENIPQTRSKYDIKPRSEHQSISHEDSSGIDDFEYCFKDWYFDLAGENVCSDDSDTIISAIIASRTPVARLAICDGLFFKVEDTEEEKYTLGSHRLQALLLREGLRTLKSFEISLRLHRCPDVKYPHWFLVAVPDTLEELKIERKFSWYLPDNPFEGSGYYFDFSFDDAIDVYDQILLRLKFPSLRRLDLSFPSGSMHLVHFIRTNNEKLRHIRLSCDEFSFRENTTRWAEVLSACLGAHHLNYLELWRVQDDFYAPSDHRLE